MRNPWCRWWSWWNHRARWRYNTRVRRDILRDMFSKHVLTNKPCGIHIPNMLHDTMNGMLFSENHSVAASHPKQYIIMAVSEPTLCRTNITKHSPLLLYHPNINLSLFLLPCLFTFTAEPSNLYLRLAWHMPDIITRGNLGHYRSINRSHSGRRKMESSFLPAF